MVRPMVVRPAALPFLALSLCLPGCAEWPDLAAPPEVAGALAPRIAPLAGLPGPAIAETAAIEDETRLLQARAAGLRARASGIAARP